MTCPVTVIILTKNEAAFVDRCIESAAWADEIIVLDSLSTDGTREIARSAGATVYEQAWLGWLGQKARAIQLARNDWIFSLDADEIVTADLAKSIRAVFEGTAPPDPRDGYVVERKDEFFGVLLPNAKRAALKFTFVRLFNRQFSRFNPETIIHETVLFPGKAIPLAGALLHWRNTTFLDQMRKDIENAPLECQLLVRKGARARPSDLLLWPVLRFLWLYVRRGFFRVGTRGFLQALMRAHADFLRYALLWEHQNVERQLHPPETLWKIPSKREPAHTANPALSLPRPSAVGLRFEAEAER